MTSVNLDMRDGSGGTLYDALGRPTAWKHFDTNQSGDPLAIGFSYGYDRVGNKRWQRVLHYTDDSQRYAYDSASRLTAFVRGNFGATEQDWMEQWGDMLRFGGLNRLRVPRLRPRMRRGRSTLGQAGPSGRHLPFSVASRPALPEGVPRFPMTQAREWTLDGVGNWSQTRTKVGGSIATESRSDTSFNEYASIGGTAQSHDANGNLTDDGTHLYEWDGLNRLVSVSDKASEAMIVSYAYDTGNRRMLLDEATASTSDTVYCYGGWQVLEEAPQSAPGAPDRQFVYGNYIDEALVMNADGNADGDCLDAGTDPAYYYLQNTLYSVYALTDASGVVVEGYSYDPYGKHTLHLDGPDAGSAVDFSSDDLKFAEGRSPHLNPYGFTGRRFDRETGLWHYRNRYYDAARARFISRDPVGYVDNASLYLYVDANPVFGTDPSGLWKLYDFLDGVPDLRMDISLSGILRKYMGHDSRTFKVLKHVSEFGVVVSSSKSSNSPKGCCATLTLQGYGSPPNKNQLKKAAKSLGGRLLGRVLDALPFNGALTFMGTVHFTDCEYYKKMSDVDYGGGLSVILEGMLGMGESVFPNAHSVGPIDYRRGPHGRTRSGVRGVRGPYAGFRGSVSVSPLAKKSWLGVRLESDAKLGVGVCWFTVNLAMPGKNKLLRV